MPSSFFVKIIFGVSFQAGLFAVSFLGHFESLNDQKKDVAAIPNAYYCNTTKGSELIGKYSQSFDWRMQINHQKR